MKRSLRRIVILLATLVAAFVAASPSLAGMNDGGGFQVYSVISPGTTCGPDASGNAYAYGWSNNHAEDVCQP